MSRHRAPARPRYGRIAAVAVSVSVTGVSVLGGVGVVGAGSGPASAVDAVGAVDPTTGSSTTGPSTTGTATPARAGRTRPAAPLAGRTLERDAPPWQPDDAALPAGSGEGRRVVFSESRQQVWLVGEQGRVQRTYLVSGSTYDNLDPGTYAVWSRSADAVGIDDSGTMRYFVRFAVGDTAAIGFHDIPVHDGRPVQRLEELGTPLSHGCVRQRRADAVALWEFAPLGTTVVVTA